MSYDVFGLGNALVDALVQVDDVPLLKRHDLKRGTMHLVNDTRWHNVYGDAGHEAQLHPGGSCANSISTVALLGGSATFCGLVGRDALGDSYDSALTTLLGTHYLRRVQGAPTGKCLSLVSTADAERTMLTDLGTAMDLSPGQLPLEAIESATWLHVTGYLFTGGRMGDAAIAALDRALHAGVKVSFDLGDAFVIQHFRDSVDLVIDRYADVVFMNEEEGRMLGGGDPTETLRVVGDRVDTVVLKLGKRGSLIRRGSEITPIEAVLVDAIDTTGAGDSYAGGFLYGLSHGWDLAACGHLASAVASITVSQMGGVVRDAEALRQLVARIGAPTATSATGPTSQGLAPGR